MERVFFISYAKQNEATIQKLVMGLEERGYSCWVSYRDIDPSEKWAKAIIHGLKQSQNFLLVASSFSNASKHVQREVSYADELDLPLICVKLEDIDLAEDLQFYFAGEEYIPAFEHSSFEETIAAIIKAALPRVDTIVTRPETPHETEKPTCQAELTRQIIQSIPLEFVHIPEGVVEQKSGGSGERSRNLLQSCFWLSRGPVSRALYGAYLKDQKKPLPPELQDATKKDEPVVVKNLQEARDFCRWAAEKTSLPIRLPVTLEYNLAAGRVHYRDLADDTNPRLTSQPPSREDWTGAFEWHPTVPILLESALKMSKVHAEGRWVFHLAYNQPLECLAEGDLVASRYEVQDLISQGGMGSVYRVRDIGSGETLALKEARLSLLPDLDDGDDSTNPGRNTLWSRKDALKVFWQEAKILGGLSHSNLPAVSTYFIENENAYLLMTFIAGKSLKSLLQERERTKRHLDPDKVMFWGTQVMDALGYCHGRNILHRDVKPDNLILTPTGKVFLVDFGLARSIICRHAPAAGTYNYAPPEQFQPAGRLSFSSDVYSLGATLYHLLTLKPPTPAPLRQQGEAILPPAYLNDAILPAYSAAVMKALELDPNRRLQNMQEFKAALYDQGPKRSRSRTLGI